MTTLGRAFWISSLSVFALALIGCDAIGDEDELSLTNLSYSIQGEEGRKVLLCMTGSRDIDSTGTGESRTWRVGKITLSGEDRTGKLRDGDYDAVKLEAKLTEDSQPTPLKLQLRSGGEVIGESTQEEDVLESGDILEVVVPTPDLDDPPNPPGEPLC